MTVLKIQFWQRMFNRYYGTASTGKYLAWLQFYFDYLFYYLKKTKQKNNPTFYWVSGLLACLRDQMKQLDSHFNDKLTNVFCSWLLYCAEV